MGPTPRPVPVATRPWHSAAEFCEYLAAELGRGGDRLLLEPATPIEDALDSLEMVEAIAIVEAAGASFSVGRWLSVRTLEDLSALVTG